MAPMRLDILITKAVLSSFIIKLPDIGDPYSTITNSWKIPSKAVLYQCLKSSLSAIIEGINVDMLLEAEIVRSGCGLK